MHLPVEIHILGRTVHPHLLLELIAYPVGFQLWLFTRRRAAGPKLDPERSLYILVGAIVGAAIGSKLLAWIEDWPTYWAHRHQAAAWLGGKTIVGGLLGGWAGVEVAKKCSGVQSRTGDAMVLPLIIAISIGRVGCFLTGLDDKTHGSPTSLPWAVDYGDGILRHPAQLYEIAALLLIGLILWFSRRRFTQPGSLFRGFMLGYLAFRFLIEFIKPVYAPYLGLSAIQLSCLTGILICVVQMNGVRLFSRRPHA